MAEKFHHNRHELSLTR